ncbi:hypothetical protein ACLOJK_006124 [Asimina triloba]
MDVGEKAASEDDNKIEQYVFPSGFLKGVKFGILTEDEMKKFAAAKIDGANDVTDPGLGVPNLGTQCSTCESSGPRNCEGERHPGMITLPTTVYHPYFTTAIIQILNKICPACKRIRQDRKTKVSRNLNDILPVDYWDFLPKDPCGQNLFIGSNKISLSPYQVFILLKDLDRKFIEKFVQRRELLFLNSFPVTPNCSRVIEMNTPFSNGCRLTFDECTRAYKRLLDFKRQLNECGQSESDGDIHCIAGHWLRNQSSSSNEDDDGSCKSGLRWIREVLLGKRTDHALRMTVIGDSKLKLGEIGIAHDICEKLLIPEHVNSRNLRKLKKCCNSRVYHMRECYVKNKSGLTSLKRRSELQLGDIVYRSLEDSDLILVNRPPSVHQHSLIAFSVKVLPMESVVAINPLCCAPLLGDFDGDCLHGFIPQSITCRAELMELVSLDHQLISGQDGRNLISLSQDSLTAAYLILESEVFLNKFEMQQLEMLCPRNSQYPAILKAPSLNTILWTGKQLFSMFLPEDLDFNDALNSVVIKQGDFLSSSADSAWLKTTCNNIFLNVIRHCHGQALDFLSAAQEVLCEWLTWRGFSVSLSDIYLSPDSCSRMKMIDEVTCGLQDVDKICCIKQLMLNDDIMEYFLEHGARNLDECYITHPPAWKLAFSSRSAFEAFKEVSSHLHDVIHQYASSNNSMLTMIKAGSKGSPQKLLQQSVCLGLQHSRDFLPFRIPGKLSCESWNQQKLYGDDQKNHDAFEFMERHISCSVVESSFFDGLNPLECLIHAVACRGNCFSENADLPGTLTRKLMFYMRDLYLTYDGTVRSAYGNQLIQFSYGISVDTPDDDNKSHQFLYERTLEYDGYGGQPVGAWSACSISEAAYGALDQPISMHEASPLIDLKICYSTENEGKGEKGTVQEVMRASSEGKPQTGIGLFEPDITDVHSPWVLHFHLRKDELKKRRLTIGSLINALTRNFKSQEAGISDSSTLQILYRDCSLGDQQYKHNGELCITVAAENSDDSRLLLDTVQDVLIPSLLSTVVKGFQECKKVEILWADAPKTSEFCPGELFVKVSVPENCTGAKLWNIVQNACSQIVDLIDWERSRPDRLYDIFHAFGIDAAWRHFLEKPSDCFIKAAKDGAADDLLGTLDTIAWGKEAPIGTGVPHHPIVVVVKCHAPAGLLDEICLHDEASGIPKIMCSSIMYKLGRH